MCLSCSGVALYFMLLKTLGYLFLIMAIISLPNLLINLSGNQGQIALSGGLSLLAATTMGKINFAPQVNVTSVYRIPGPQLVPYYSLFDIAAMAL
jgi:hypothetical protein